MQRVSRASAVSTMPSPPAGGAPGFFTGGNPGAGQPATVPGFEWFNSVQEELIHLIARSGLTPAIGDLQQLRKSLDRLFGGGAIGIETNVTLTPDDAGFIYVNASSGARVITLPDAGAMAGRPIRFLFAKFDASANPVTITCNGTDIIDGGTSVVLRSQFESVSLISYSDSSWVTDRGRFATAAETDAGVVANHSVKPASLGIATRSFAANGYLRLPGGLIMQWGTATGSASADVPVTFPIAFPNALRWLGGNPTGNVNNFHMVFTSESETTTGFSFNVITSGGRNAQAVNWLAIGH